MIKKSAVSDKDMADFFELSTDRSDKTVILILYKMQIFDQKCQKIL